MVPVHGRRPGQGAARPRRSPSRPGTTWPATARSARARTTTFVWTNAHWRLKGYQPTELLGLVLLETRDHYDSFADMPDDLLAELGPLTARIERAVLGLGGIARVHVLRYGDGGEHFHLWFMPRPLGALQMRGSMLPVWMDVLPKLPEARGQRGAGPHRGRARPRPEVAVRTPDGPPPPPAVQRLRVRYAKRGRLRFTSHRDFQRAFERALRRADVPMAFSAGFSPHPKVSYANAAPTGAASEAEYVEIGVTQRCDPERVRAPSTRPCRPGSTSSRSSRPRRARSPSGSRPRSGRSSCPASPRRPLGGPWRPSWRADEVVVERLTKDGIRTFDARAPRCSPADVRVGTADGERRGGRAAVCDT